MQERASITWARIAPKATTIITKTNVKLYEILAQNQLTLTFNNTRAYGAIAPEPLGCASHSYLLTEESVMDKRTN